MESGAIDRRGFSAAMATVIDGMSKDSVLSVLGEPDTRRTIEDTGVSSETEVSMQLPFGTCEMWCYGRESAFGMPTLGHVYFDQVGITHHCRARPLPAEGLERLFDETELRTILRLLDRATPPNDSFRPQNLVETANRMRPLGKSKILAAIAEYARVVPDTRRSGVSDGVFLVLRILFEIPEGLDGHPGLRFGMSPKPPADVRSSNRFPILLRDDVPLLLTEGYTIFGYAHSADAYLDFYAENGRLRSSPLTPTNSPFSVLEGIEPPALAEWIRSESYLRGKMIGQLLEMVSFAYEPACRNRFVLSDVAEQDLWLTVFRNECSSLGLRWDSDRFEYVVGGC